MRLADLSEPLKGFCQYYALIGLMQASGLVEVLTEEKTMGRCCRKAGIGWGAQGLAFGKVFLKVHKSIFAYKCIHRLSAILPV